MQVQDGMNGYLTDNSAVAELSTLWMDYKLYIRLFSKYKVGTAGTALCWLLGHDICAWCKVQQPGGWINAIADKPLVKLMLQDVWVRLSCSGYALYAILRIGNKTEWSARHSESHHK